MHFLQYAQSFIKSGSNAHKNGRVVPSLKKRGHLLHLELSLTCTLKINIMTCILTS